MQNYYGFDGDDVILIGAFYNLGQALKASKEKGFFFVASEDHWKALGKKLDRLFEDDLVAA